MFFYVLIIFAILVTVLTFSEIKINIKNIRISTEKIDGRILAKNYQIILCWNIFKKVPIQKIKIINENIYKLGISSKIKKIDLTKIRLDDFKENKIKITAKFKPQIEYINLYMDIGTEDAAFTSYVVTIISAIFGIVLKTQMERKKENKFIINPIYINKNLLNLKLDCIINIKVIHIIYIIIYILNKKRRDDKYGRTSNRRSYGYSYE